MLIYTLLWIVYGLSTSILVGQSFFVMMHTSITQWFPKAFAFLLWSNISDPIIAGIAYYMVDYLLEWVVGVNITLWWHIAALLSIILGIFIIIQKVSLTNIASDIHVSFWYMYAFLKGCLINMIGPFQWITWLAISSYFIIENNWIWFIRFAVWTFLSFVITDIIKAYYAQKISNYLSSNVLKKVQRVLWIIIITIGLLIWQKMTLCSDDIDVCIQDAQTQIENIFERNNKTIIDNL